MAVPKYAQLYAKKSSTPAEDKAFIEALRQRLNERLAKDPASCQKAARILENWLREAPKK